MFRRRFRRSGALEDVDNSNYNPNYNHISYASTRTNTEEGFKEAHQISVLLSELAGNQSESILTGQPDLFEQSANFENEQKQPPTHT